MEALQEANDGVMKANTKQNRSHRVTNHLFQKKQVDHKLAKNRNLLKELVRGWRRKKRWARQKEERKKVMEKERGEEEEVEEEEDGEEEVEVVEEEERKRAEKAEGEVQNEKKKAQVRKLGKVEEQNCVVFDELEATVIGCEGATLRLLPSMTSKPLYLLRPGTKLKISKKCKKSNRVFCEVQMKVQGKGSYVEVIDRIKADSDDEDEDEDEDEGRAPIARALPIDFESCSKILIGGWASIKSKMVGMKDLGATERELATKNLFLDDLSRHWDKENEKDIVRAFVISEIGCQLRETPMPDSDRICVLEPGSQVLILNPDAGFKTTSGKVLVKFVGLGNVTDEKVVMQKIKKSVVGWASLTSVGGYPIISNIGM